MESSKKIIYLRFNFTARRARVFYRGPTATLCDICEGEDCGNICSVEAEARESRLLDAASGKANSAMDLHLSVYAALIIPFADILRRIIEI